VVMAGVVALCAVRQPTPAMAAPGDDGYTHMNPRATPKRDHKRRDALERRDHGERLVQRYFGEVTTTVEWAMRPYQGLARCAERTRG
jgi:hypothetical protein